MINEKKIEKQIEQMVDNSFDYKGFHFQRLYKDDLWYVTYQNKIVNHGQYRNDLTSWIDNLTLPDREKILEVMKEVIVTTQGLDQTEVTEDAKLKDDLSMDSLDVVEFGMEMEKEYNIAISDEIWDDIQNYTIGELIDYIIQNK